MASIKQVREKAAGSERIADVPIFEPDGTPYRAKDGSPATIGVYGPESKRHNAARDALTQKLIRQGGKKPTPEALRQTRIEQAAAVVARWHGWEAEDGAEIRCDHDNVVELLRTDHVLEQVEAGISGHADFFERSSSN